MTLDADKAWELEQFDRCREWIRASLETTSFKTHDVEHIRQGIERGNLQIWPTQNSVLITEIILYPTGVMAINNLIGGGRLEEIKQTVRSLEDYGRIAGCGFMITRGREGWGRALPGFTRDHSVFVKEL